MKSLFSAFIIAAAVITACLFCSHQIDELTEELTAKNMVLLQNIIDEDFDKALQYLDEIDNTIKTNDVLLASYMDHTEINKIETQLAQLRIYISEGEKITALAQVSSLDLLFKHLPEDYHVKLENVF